MAEKFLKLGKEREIHVQESQRVPNNLRPKRPKTRNVIIKMAKIKDKERALKAARQKQLVTYKKTAIII